MDKSKNSGFPKDFRLRTKKDFSYLKFDGQQRSVPFLKIHFKRGRYNSGVTRIGICTTKKLGKANKRNRVKRIIREAFRCSLFKHLDIDGLVVVNPSLFKKINSSQKCEQIIKNNFLNLMKHVSQTKDGNGLEDRAI